MDERILRCIDALYEFDKELKADEITIDSLRNDVYILKEMVEDRDEMIRSLRGQLQDAGVELEDV